jgi:hypothetical protein
LAITTPQIEFESEIVVKIAECVVKII